MLKTKPKRGDELLIVCGGTKYRPEIVTIISSGSVNLTVIHHDRKEKFDVDGQGNSYFELWEPDAYYVYVARNELVRKTRKLIYPLSGHGLDFDGFSEEKLNRIIEAIES